MVPLLVRRSTTLALGFLIVANALHAQEPDSAQGKPDGSTSIPRLGPVVVTGSAVPAPAGGLGLAVSVISDSVLELRQPLYAADAFRGVTGVFVDEAVGPGGPTILRIRGGEEVFTQILMDGVAINQNGGFFDFQGFPLTNVERVEVVRGPQSALYGSSAVSGAVQFLTRRGKPGPPRVTASAEGGATRDPGGNVRAGASVRGGSDRLLYSAGAGLAYSRGLFDVAHSTWTRDASLRLDAVPHSRWDVTGYLRYIDIEANLPVRDPGATRVPLDPNARNARQRVISSLEAAYRASNTWTHRLRGSVYRDGFQYVDEFDDVANTGAYEFFVFDANFTLDSRLWRWGVDYLGSVDVAPGSAVSRLNFSYGGQIEREALTDVTTGDFGDGVLTLGRTSVAGFAETQIQLGPRATVLAGARLERFGSLSAQITPRVAARVVVVPSVLSLRASVGRAYKAPNLQQQYQDNPFIVSNPDLTPETSISWETGIGLTPHPSLDVSATFFRQDFDDLIQLVPSDVDERSVYRNLSAARVLGIELTTTFAPAKAWRIGAEGAWLKSRVLDNAGLAEAAFPIDSALPFRPTVTGSAFVHWEPSGRLSAMIRSRVVGSQIVLSERFSGRRVEIDAYALLGIFAQYRLVDNAHVYARVENVLNTAYETSFDRPGIPRTLAMGFRIGN